MKQSKANDMSALAREWLYYEASGARLRMAHRCIEWDGWEEGLVESILGPEDEEEDWFKDIATSDPSPRVHSDNATHVPGTLKASLSRKEGAGNPVSLARRKLSIKLPFAMEQEKEQVLDTTGDICGGRGGELGRRLEAWLTVTGVDEDGRPRRWSHIEESRDEVEAL